eukprot:SAG31_NODE_46993_length_252_cov_0.673203_1_plen_83_part_11
MRDTPSGDAEEQEPKAKPAGWSELRKAHKKASRLVKAANLFRSEKEALQTELEQQRKKKAELAHRRREYGLSLQQALHDGRKL